MARSTIFFILSAFLMVQLIQARYGPRGFVLWNMFEDGVRERIPMKNTIAQTSMVNEQMKEITKIMKETVTTSRDIFKTVIREAYESENQTPEFHAHVTNLTQFTESVGRMLQAPEHSQMTWIFEEFEELTHIMNRYDLDVTEHTSEEVKFFKRLLDQNNMSSVKRMFTLSCVGFVQSFDDAVAQYIAALTPEQKNFESEFISWFQETTAARDYNNMKWLDTVLARFDTKLLRENN